MVAVVKCRVSINGEMREGGGEGRRGGRVQVSAVGQWRFASGGGGRGSEREQSASWGRDIGVSNKQTTDTYKYIGCTGLFLNTHNVADSRECDRAQKHFHSSCQCRINLSSCVRSDRVLLGVILRH